jgi:hypothetical protein
VIFPLAILSHQIGHDKSVPGSLDSTEDERRESDIATREPGWPLA